jgi:hypothetical protein
MAAMYQMRRCAVGTVGGLLFVRFGRRFRTWSIASFEPKSGNFAFTCGHTCIVH